MAVYVYTDTQKKLKNTFVKKINESFDNAKCKFKQGPNQYMIGLNAFRGVLYDEQLYQ